MSKEWAHNAAWKEVPTVNNVTPAGYAVASSAARGAFAVAGTGPRGEVCAQLVQDGSGFMVACTAMSGDVVVKRPGERESDIGGVQAQPNQVIGALPGVLVVSDVEPEVPACVAGVDLVPLVA